MRDVLLALFGAALIVAGVALWSVPAALIVAGVTTLTAAYIGRYLEVSQREDA